MSDRQIMIVLPLAFTNAGSRTGVIEDLRLIFEDEPEEPLLFQNIRPEMHPEIGKPTFASPIVVPGQESVLKFCQFVRETGRPPEAGIWAVRLEYRHGPHSFRWRELLEFDWGVNERGAKDLGAFITHRNAGTED